MRLSLLFPLIALSACASSTPDLQSMSTVDVCYLGLKEPAKRKMLDAEVHRRNESCADHVDELIQMTNNERRVRGLPTLSLPEPSYPSPSAAAPSQSQSALTGTRLPTSDQEAGSSSVSGVSKDDYMHDRNAGMAPLPGEPTARGGR